MNLLRVEDVDALLQSAPQGAAVHLVGIGGCGVSGLAHLLLDLGLRVSGSDLAENEFTRALRLRGAEIQTGHAPELLQRVKPVLVAYSSAIRANNPELAAAEQMGVPIVRRAVLLAAIVGRRELICVAGMHGKTTTTALLAFALEHLDAVAGYAVGAAVPQLERHARFNPAPVSPALFACEADESDGTLCAFSPAHSIVLNVDAEHLDYYSGIEAVTEEFARFSQRTSGRLIFCADDERLAKLFAHRMGAVSYGFNPLAAYRAEMKLPDEHGTHFEVWHHGLKLGDFRTPLIGEKNVSNATAVIAMLHQIGCDPEDIARAIEPFRGASRRQELRFSDARFQVYDDYAHHPREITAVLGALRTRQPRRVLAVFQPHRHTRTQRLMKEFATAFQAADRLWVAEIYSAGETPIPGVNAAALADAIRATGQTVDCLPDADSAVEAVRAAMQPGDMVVFLGAGDITDAAARLAEMLSTERSGPADELLAALAARVSSDTVVRRDEPLAKRTTLRVGGTADFYVEPADERDLGETLRFCKERALKFTVLGRGSNLLIRDGGIRGMVICLAHPHFSRVEVFDDSLRCGAGALMKNVSIEARKNGLAGLEFLEGIPGNVGGGLRMNAGAMGKWMFEAVETLWFMDYDGNLHERRGSEVNVEYRGCPLLRSAIALGVVLKGEPAAAAAIADVMKEYSSRRWETQPKQPSAGCIFKNPREIPAGRLIEELGLKGTRIGGAMVSEVHGNFIVNTGEATADDVLRLIDVVKQRARAARGIELETEVEILGE